MKFFLPLFFLASILVFGNTALAQSADSKTNPLGFQIVNCTGGTDNLGACVTSIYKFGVASVAILAASVIIWGGFVWLTSGGNVSRVASAKEWIYGAVLGLVLALTSFLLLNTINPQLTNVFIKVPGGSITEDLKKKVFCYIEKRENGECVKSTGKCFEVSEALAGPDCKRVETDLQCARRCNSGETPPTYDCVATRQACLDKPGIIVDTGLCGRDAVAGTLTCRTTCCELRQ